MPRMVKGPDGIVRSFPDDATDAEISAALETPPATARSKPARSWTDLAVDALPSVGGALGGIVGGIGGTVLGMGVGGVPGAVGGAALGGAGGEGFKQAINFLRGQPSPTTEGAAALEMAKQGGLQGALEAGGAAVSKGLAVGGKAVYRGYLKPSLAKSSVGKANEIVDAAIDEALPVTRAGVGEARNIIGTLRAKVDDILATTSGTVDLKSVADRLRTWAKAEYGHAGMDADYDAALAVADSLDKSSALAQTGRLATDVPLSEANTIKRGLYRQVGTNQYGMPSQPATTARKAAGRFIKEDLEAAAPSIAPLNARESKLIPVAKAINQAVEREANQNPLYGMKTIAAGGLALGAGGGTYAISHDPIKGAAALALTLAGRVALSPAVATRAAIVAQKLGEQGIAAPLAARLAVQAVSEMQGQAGEQPASE